jgi:hypothetical protein
MFIEGSCADVKSILSARLVEVGTPELAIEDDFTVGAANFSVLLLLLRVSAFVHL